MMGLDARIFTQVEKIISDRIMIGILAAAQEVSSTRGEESAHQRCDSVHKRVCTWHKLLSFVLRWKNDFQPI